MSEPSPSTAGAAAAVADQAAFREALSRWASGVTIITGDGGGGPVGLTASAFSSLSLDPPLVLACVAHSSTSYEALVSAPGFAVHVLAAHQEDLSNRFARTGGDKFAGLEYERGPFGAPLLPVGLARLVCALDSTPPGGDHTILVGRVVQVDLGGGEPLLHYARAYRCLGA